MKELKLYCNLLPYFVAPFEGEADPPATDPPATDPPVTDPPATVKTFTQDEVDVLIAKASKGGKAALSEIESMKTKIQLTTEERDDLDSTIKDLQTQIFTKEELAKSEIKKQQKAHDSAVEDLTKERDKWQNLFTNSTIKGSITKAANKNNAYDSDQFEAILRPLTRLEKNEEGLFDVVVDYPTLDDKGDPKILKLSPSKTIEAMKENPKYFNLFKADGKSGLGLSKPASGKEMTAAEAAKDPEKYREYRKKLFK